MKSRGTQKLADNIHTVRYGVRCWLISQQKAILVESSDKDLRNARDAGWLARVLAKENGRNAGKMVRIAKKKFMSKKRGRRQIEKALSQRPLSWKTEDSNFSNFSN